LKQIAKILAHHKGCQVIAEEVIGFADKTISEKKGIVDVAGVKLSWKATNLDIITYGYEAKATLQDFKNGFNAGADFTYVIAPKGVIPKELIPKDIGFYEVDLQDYKLSYLKNYSGVNLILKPRNRHKKKHQKTRTKFLIEIARRLTNIDLYKNCKIEVSDFL